MNRVSLDETETGSGSAQAATDPIELALVAAGQMAFHYDPGVARLSLFGAVRELTGRSADAIGTQLLDLLAIVHPEDRALMDAGSSDATLAPSEAVRRLRCVHPDGSTVPCEVRGNLFGQTDADETTSIRCGVFTRAAEDEHALERDLRLNQKRLSHALEVSRLGEWSMDLRALSSIRSARVADIFGHTDASEPWSYKIFLSQVHPDDRERVDRLFSRSLETGRDLDLEARIIRKDGELRWISTRGSINHGLGDDRRVIGSVIKDITSRKLTEQRDRFFADVSVPLNSLVDHRSTLEQVARLAVPILGEHCSIDLVDASGELERIVSTSALLVQEALGDTPPGQPASGTVRRMLDTGEPVLIDVVNNEAIGDIARTEPERSSLQALQIGSYLGVPLTQRSHRIGILHFYRTAGGSCFGAHERSVALGLATRVAVALENARLFQAVQESDDRKDEFLAMLSHELRNPLESLSVAVDLIDSDAADDEQREWARTMMRGQIGRLASILESLLDVSRYSLDKIVLDRTETDLEQLVSSAVDAVRDKAERCGYTLRFESAQGPFRAVVDRLRISQALGNLLANAIKYGLNRGLIHVVLDSEALASGNVARMTVGDEGIGLEAGQLSNVFKLFAQIDTTIDRAPGGLGMGLTLVKRITEMHHGTIEAQSPGVGHGSTFTLRLPALAPRRATSRDAVMVKNAVQLGDGGTGRRLLLVDDNTNTVDALQKLFEMHGYEVETANDGLSAIALAESFRPQLAVLDIGLPGANGYEVAEMLRANASQESLLLIALSGYGQAKDRNRSREAGFDHHLLKPVSFSTIIELLQRASS